MNYIYFIKFSYNNNTNAINKISEKKIRFVIEYESNKLNIMCQLIEYNNRNAICCFLPTTNNNKIYINFTIFDSENNYVILKT